MDIERDDVERHAGGHGAEPSSGFVRAREVLLTEVKMRLLGDPVSRRTAWRIAREHGWDTIAEAEYLAVARLQADAPVTIDDSLARRAQGIVPLAPLEAPVSE